MSEKILVTYSARTGTIRGGSEEFGKTIAGLGEGRRSQRVGCHSFVGHRGIRASEYDIESDKSVKPTNIYYESSCIR